MLTEAQTAYDKSKSDVKLGWTGGAMKASVIALSDASQALELAKTRLDAANKALASAEVAARSGQAVAAAARESKG